MFLPAEIFPAIRLAVLSLALGAVAASAEIDQDEILRECQSEVGTTKTPQELQNEFNMYRDQPSEGSWEAASEVDALLQELGNCIANKLVPGSTDP